MCVVEDCGDKIVFTINLAHGGASTWNMSKFIRVIGQLEGIGLCWEQSSVVDPLEHWVLHTSIASYSHWGKVISLGNTSTDDEKRTLLDSVVQLGFSETNKNLRFP